VRLRPGEAVDRQVLAEAFEGSRRPQVLMNLPET